MERGAGSTKETGTLPALAAKVEGELEADDCYNSMPGENHPFRRAQFLTGRANGGGRTEGERGESLPGAIEFSTLENVNSLTCQSIMPTECSSYLIP